MTNKHVARPMADILGAIVAATGMPVAEGTTREEAERVLADIEHQRDRERIRDQQAIRLQDQYEQRIPGML